MRTKFFTALCFGICFLPVSPVIASLAFPAPPGGWSYEFNGDQLNTTNNAVTDWGTYPVSLDGTWRFGGGSDTFDGSTNGGTFSTNNVFGTANNPGGWTSYNEGGVTFIRMQDTGDPRTVGFKDPSNRKLMMARSLSFFDTASSSQLSDGFTVCFRARIPTPSKASGDLDPLYPAAAALGGPGPIPYPAGGDGYVTFNGGKGNIMMHEVVGDPTYGGSIAFSLTQTNDNNGAATNQAGFAGLTMNELNGNTANNNVNFGQGSGTNVYALDPTDWHEFWIVLKADPSGRGTHEAYIFVDGNLTPKLFHMTAGASEGSVDPSGVNFGPASVFIAIASPSTGQSCAFDLDFLDYKIGEFYPEGAINNLPPQVGANSPGFGQPFYAVAGNLSVEALTAGTNSISTTGAKLTLNGVDVSAGLAASGSAQDRIFTYSSLQPNTLYTGNMILSDQAGRSVTNAFSFDTFVEAQVTIIESEDYNFGSGQGSNSPPAGAFAGLTGTYGVDFSDSSLWSLGVYRANDAVDTDVTGDFPRPRFTGSGATDYQIGLIARGEWCNYTRPLPSGSYSAVLRAASAGAQDVRLDLVTSSAGAPNQTVKFLGTFHVPNTGGPTVFSDVLLTDMQGNLLPLILSGTTTLRLTAVSANNDLSLNYLVLVPVTASPTPVVSSSPEPNAVGVLPNAAVEAAIYDGGSPVDSASVVLSINGSVVNPTVVKSGGVTLVKYTPSNLWPVLSSNYASLSFTNGTSHNVSWNFAVAYLPSLTPAMKVADAATPGFGFRVFQNENDDAPSTIRAETQLAGLSSFTNRADPTAQGPADAQGVPGADPDHDPLSYHIPTVINMSQGNANYGNFAPDDLMPGIPGVGPEGGKDGIGAEIKTFISLPAGVVTMVVNSDDGFKVQAGFLNDAPLELADVEGLFGDADLLFRFIVQQAGVYPFRMVWYQSDHGFGVEWMIVNNDGTHGLINDTSNTQQTGPAAFSTGTIPVAPHPTLAIQQIGGGQVSITWGANGTLQSATSVNGPYQDILNAVSPYTTSSTGTKFYRVRVP